MVGQPVVQVDLPGLARVGQVVSHSAQAFRSAFESNAEVLDAGSPPGWASSAAIGQARHAWQGFVADCAAQVRQFGDGLSGSAAALQASDQTAADRLGHTGAVPR